MDWMLELQSIGQVALAMLLGGLIGVEREIANKPAGFRTHMMVAGAAALILGLGDSLLIHFAANADVRVVRTDPVRLVEAIVTGISFLGAGTIFRRGQGDHIEGLTTAASILVSAAIGISVATFRFVLAIGITLLTLLVLRGMRTVEGLIRKGRTGV